MDGIAVERAPARLARHYAYLQMRVPDAWVSFGLVFLVAASGLVSETGGSKLAQMIYVGASGIALVIFPHFALKAIVRNALLWLFPFWAILSTFWSLEPLGTLHGTTMVLITMVPVCFIGSIPHRQASNAGFFLALLVFVMYSAVHGKMWQVASDEMFSGALAGKNQFGHICAMEVLISLGMLAWAREREGIAIMAVAGFGFLLGFAALIASHATGSLLSTLVGIGCFTAILSFRRLSPPFRITVIAGLAAMLTLYIFFGEELQKEVVANVMHKFGKDTTLTGRTLLWQIADRMIAQHPLIGRGVGSFWSLNNPDAWMIWREMGVQPGHGFTFHNTFRDILVDTGWIGLGLFLVPIGWRFVLGWLHALRSGTVTDACRVAILTYFLMRTPVETISYGALTMDIFLLIGFLCLPVTIETHWRRVVKPVSTEREARPLFARDTLPSRTRAPVRATALREPEFRPS